MSLRKFTIGVNAFSAKVKVEQLQLKKKIAFKADELLKKATPIDLGTARNSWIANLGDGGDFPIDNGMGNAAKIMSDTDPNRPIVFGNGIEYIGKLDAGSSSQAPNGIVAPVMAALKTRFGR